MEATVQETTAEVGHNNPPEELTPFEALGEEIADIYSEAMHWLDGDAITEAQAPEIEKISAAVKALSKLECAMFKETKEPHRLAGLEVDQAHNPLKKALEDTKATCNEVLTPLRIARENARLAEEQRLRDESAAAQKAAQEAAQNSQGNLAEKQRMDELENQAKHQTAAANKIAKKATGLRTSYVTTLTNSADAATHYFNAQREEFDAFLLSLAKSDVRAGQRDIPGFEITQVKTAQ